MFSTFSSKKIMCIFIYCREMNRSMGIFMGLGLQFMNPLTICNNVLFWLLNKYQNTVFSQVKGYLWGIRIVFHGVRDPSLLSIHYPNFSRYQRPTLGRVEPLTVSIQGSKEGLSPTLVNMARPAGLRIQSFHSPQTG
ncbi:hypothetical protein QUC31_005150 [Theobroma cacao]|uniref:Uncharacterized protein n=1 Tax=Theobroma cacao TaxID=3641 RepID=A0A061DSK7_THECC|nr:Uncharacterized protein TCM_005114 [Theobroma cacao]